MIVGLGIDVCEIARLRRAMARHGPRFIARVLTVEERAYCEKHRDPATPFAGRFAVKEAAVKALGNPKGLGWHDMEVIRSEDGAPSLVLHGLGAETAAKLGVTRKHVSITHDGGVAAAVVILERA